MIKSIIILTLITFIYNNGSSQDIIKLGEKTAKKVQRKVDSGINRSIDKTLNDAEKEIKNSGKKTPDKKQVVPQKQLVRHQREPVLQEFRKNMILNLLIKSIIVSKQMI